MESCDVACEVCREYVRNLADVTGSHIIRESHALVDFEHSQTLRKTYKVIVAHVCLYVLGTKLHDRKDFRNVLLLYLLEHLGNDYPHSVGTLEVIAHAFSDTSVSYGLYTFKSLKSRLFDELIILLIDIPGGLIRVLVQSLDLDLVNVYFYTADRVYKVDYHLEVERYVLVDIQVQRFVQHAHRIVSAAVDECAVDLVVRVISYLEISVAVH